MCPRWILIWSFDDDDRNWNCVAWMVVRGRLEATRHGRQPDGTTKPTELYETKQKRNKSATENGTGQDEDRATTRMHCWGKFCVNKNKEDTKTFVEAEQRHLSVHVCFCELAFMFVSVNLWIGAVIFARRGKTTWLEIDFLMNVSSAVRFNAWSQYLNIRFNLFEIQAWFCCDWKFEYASPLNDCALLLIWRRGLKVLLWT